MPQSSGKARKALVILIGIIAVVGVFCIFYFARTKYNNYPDLFELRYGDRCNWETEMRRINLTSSLSSSTVGDDATVGLLTWTYEQEFLQKAEPFCNKHELLACNKTTRTCDCGDPFASIYSQRRGTVKFVKERGNKCRWGRGSYCFPKNVDSSAMSVSLEYECEAGTLCQSVSAKGKECTSEMVKDYLNQAAKGEGFWEGMYSGKVCTCQTFAHPLLGFLEVLN